MYTTVSDPILDPNLPKLELSIGIEGFEPHTNNIPNGYLAHDFNRLDLLSVD